MEKATARLAEIARHYAAPVLMANGVGPADNFVSAGKTTVWNTHGSLVGQLDETQEGFIIFDTVTEELIFCLC